MDAERGSRGANLASEDGAPGAKILAPIDRGPGGETAEHGAAGAGLTEGRRHLPVRLWRYDANGQWGPVGGDGARRYVLRVGDPREPKDELHCVARVRVVLEIPVVQPWDSRTTVAQVHAEARREALEKLERLAPHYARVGEPVIEVVSSHKARLG